MTRELALSFEPDSMVEAMVRSMDSLRVRIVRGRRGDAPIATQRVSKQGGVTVVASGSVLIITDTDASGLAVGFQRSDALLQTAAIVSGAPDLLWDQTVEIPSLVAEGDRFTLPVGGQVGHGNVPYRWNSSTRTAMASFKLTRAFAFTAATRASPS